MDPCLDTVTATNRDLVMDADATYKTATSRSQLTGPACALAGTDLADVPKDKAVLDMLVVSVIKAVTKKSHDSLPTKLPQRGQVPGPLFCHPAVSPITPYQLNSWLFIFH